MGTDDLAGVRIRGNLRKLNDVLFFDIIAELGIPCFWTHRANILQISYILALFSMFTSVFGIFSISPSESITQAAPWSYGISDSLRVWVGLHGAVWESIVGATTITSYVTWTDPACSDSPENPFCTNCDTGGKAAAFLVLLSCATRVPGFMLLKARMNPISDIPLIKFLGILMEGSTAVCLMGAMFVWREYCHVQLPAQSSITYSYGSGFILISAGFCSTVIVTLVHTLLPTEDPYDDFSLLDEHFACCSAKARVSQQNQKLKERQVQPHGFNEKHQRKKKNPTGGSVQPSPQSQIEMDRSFNNEDPERIAY